MPCDKKHPKNPGAEQPYASEHDSEGGPMSKGSLGDSGVEREAEGRSVLDEGLRTTTPDGQGR